MGSHLLKGEAHPRVELSVVRIDDFGLGLEDTLLPENAHLNHSSVRKGVWSLNVAAANAQFVGSSYSSSFRGQVGNLSAGDKRTARKTALFGVVRTLSHC